MGFTEALTTRLRSMTRTNDASNKLAAMGSDTEAKLRLLFPSQDALEKFLAKAQTERTFLRTNRAAQGGSTTAKQTGDLGADVLAGATYGPEGMARAAMRSLGNGFQGGAERGIRTAEGNMLLSQGPKANSLFEELAALSRRNRAGQSFKQFLSGAAPVAGAGLLQP